MLDPLAKLGFGEKDPLRRLGFYGGGNADDPLKRMLKIADDAEKALALQKKAEEERNKVVQLRGQKGDVGPIGPQGPQGPAGPQGKDGKDGPKGDIGPAGPQGFKGDQGPSGSEGKEGPQGPMGPMPKHKIKDNRIAFEEAPGVWGEWIHFNTITQYTGGSSLDRKTKLQWIDYASGYSAEPTLLQTIADGDVYEYTYTNGTLYRLVPSGAAVDSFYRRFESGVLSGLVIEKTIKI